MQYIVDFDRFTSSPGSRRYWAGSPGAVWPLVALVATKFNSLSFDVSNANESFRVSGGVVEGHYALFQTSNDAGLIFLFNKINEPTDYIDIIDRRCPHICFIPRSCFMSYDDFALLGTKVLANESSAAYELPQIFSTIGFPDGDAGGNQLVGSLIKSDETDGALYPGRWKLGVRRVLPVA